MRIKKFAASNIKEATEMMKKELGPEAIILHTRKISKNGLLKSLGGEEVEITAAIDELPVPATTSHLPQTYSRRNMRQSSPSDGKNISAAQEMDTADILESLKKMSGSFEDRAAVREEEQPVSAAARETSDMMQLRADVEDMKGLLHTLTNQLQYKHFGDMPEAVKQAYMTLLQQDVDEKFVMGMTNQIIKKISGDRTASRSIVDQIVLKNLSDQFSSVRTHNRHSAKPKIVILVGPTGVGKTTTIAKLAATEKLVHGKKVGLISCDTYRIGAIEQLKTFAVIADIPMQVVYRAGDLPSAIKKFQKHDILFIDTVGRSQNAKKDILELKKIIQAAKADEVHLVVSAQTNTRTLTDIANKFQTVDPTHLLFSKLDEAAIFGPLYNIMQKTKLPVSYFTTGQAVPDDICVADGTKFAAMLYQGTFAHA
ncbi:MAG: flagellar biosynthesis protein FlhF [Bacteroidota bacterium]|jgi:flagellar biosynthesis protein FlhF